jgi:hypothetical protein
MKVKKRKLDYTQGPGACPNCGSEDLEYDGSKTYDNSIGYPFTCNNCEWEDEEYCNIEFVGFKSQESEVSNDE